MSSEIEWLGLSLSDLEGELVVMGVDAPTAEYYARVIGALMPMDWRGAYEEFHFADEVPDWVECDGWTIPSLVETKTCKTAIDAWVFLIERRLKAMSPA